jgi:hypothetical protein
MPSRDPGAEASYLTEVLGGRLVFAIERFETRVAMVELGDGSPHLLLAHHLEGERPILIYRVADIDAAIGRLEERGWEAEPKFEIPPGVCCAFRAEGGHRIGIYERTRDWIEDRLSGRLDF